MKKAKKSSAYSTVSAHPTGASEVVNKSSTATGSGALQLNYASYVTKLNTPSPLSSRKELASPAQPRASEMVHKSSTANGSGAPQLSYASNVTKVNTLSLSSTEEELAVYNPISPQPPSVSEVACFTSPDSGASAPQILTELSTVRMEEQNQANHVSGIRAENGVPSFLCPSRPASPMSFIGDSPATGDWNREDPWSASTPRNTTLPPGLSGRDSNKPPAARSLQMAAHSRDNNSPTAEQVVRTFEVEKYFRSHFEEIIGIITNKGQRDALRQVHFLSTDEKVKLKKRILADIYGKLLLLKHVVL